ncbi:MAG: hypothetical protein AB2L16_08840 [Anaerolineaceae bacterium]
MGINKNLRIIALSLLICALLLGGCKAGSSAELVEATPQSPSAAIPLDLEVKGSVFEVIQGGYGFEAPAGSDVSITASGALISALDSSLLFSLNGINAMSNEKSDEEILDTLLTSLFSGEQSSYKQSELISSSVEGYEGAAYDFTGKFLGSQVEGRALVIKPEAKRYVSIVAMALVEENPDLWKTTGKDAFNYLLSRYQILPAEALASAELCPISPNANYGFYPDEAVKVGGGLLSGPLRERAYLDNLLGSNGEPVTYEWVRSVETPDSIVDEYTLTVGEKTITLYLDQYSFGIINAPRGLGCMGAFPISEP